jgi:patatin-like phospholipase/acyl hydrolase
MKRILALDGGGIRGMFSLQILARIEELFRQDRNEPNLVLADVFDFIAGTSTGAIIATFLALGENGAGNRASLC